MTTLRSPLRLLIAPLALLACAGAAHALEVTYDDDPGLRRPLKPVTEQQRQIDLALGNCLKANGGRMAPRCAALRDKSTGAEISAKAAEEQTKAQAPVVPEIVPPPMAEPTPAK